jgi:hypothetical protein
MVNPTFAPQWRANSANSAKLAAFTLVRGGPSKGSYDMFVSSRNCLHTAISSAIIYDDIAFHEGNVPNAIQRMLQHKM